MCHSHSQQTQTVKHISSLCRYLTEDATKQLVTTCALSRLDYCSSVLMGTPLLFNQFRKFTVLLQTLNLRALQHQSHTPLMQNFTDTGSQFLKESNTILLSHVKHSHKFFLSYLFELPHLYNPSCSLGSLSDTHAQTPVLPPQNPWLSFILSLWSPHLEQSPPRHQALC